MKLTNDKSKHISGIERRDLLKLVGASSLLLPGVNLAFAQSSGAATPRNSDTMVVIYLRGAMDGLNAIIPFTDPAYYSKRPTIAIAKPDAATDAAIALNSRFAMHPSMAPLKPLWDKGEMAAVHAVGLTVAQRSHFDAQDFMERAWLEKGSVFTGWLNRHLSSTALSTEQTFRALGMGRAVPKSLGGPAPVIGLNSIEGFGIQSSSTRKVALTDGLEALFNTSASLDVTARRAFAAVDELANKNLTAVTTNSAASYPNTTFGKQMRDLATLIKSGIGAEVATCDLGGWDTHNNEATEIASKLDELSKTLAAFATDLGPAWKNVSVLTMTEFGRRVQENGSRGTDHGRASAMLLLGGGVAGKQVFADWPGLADNQLESGDLRVTTDYRSVLSELLRKRSGNQKLDEVFPGFTGSKDLGLFVTRG